LIFFQPSICGKGGDYRLVENYCREIGLPPETGIA